MPQTWLVGEDAPHCPLTARAGHRHSQRDLQCRDSMVLLPVVYSFVRHSVASGLKPVSSHCALQHGHKLVLAGSMQILAGGYLSQSNCSSDL
jgi:hypothetical protein